ncbi:PAP2 superfamily protein [Prevotella communis]|uniref:PAP2 superfamily protein n=2 Tax=Prevotella communis TaxID=2913614 RepID=A0A1H0I118_9BACT|nr:PAP2 superfamily protein [Prevotella communis]SDO25152.1 PAP2 superfamily protein [Prevotella communis]
MINKSVLIRLVSLYVIPYLLLLTAILVMMYIYPKPELHLMLNSFHSGVLDFFFKFYTLMAEWPLYVLAFLPSLWKRNKMTLFFAMCELTGGTILQILKHTISNPRPVSVFEDYPDLVLPLVQGVDMHHSNSFPSGHASTFFMFCTCSVIVLAYFFSRKDALKTLRNQILFDVALVALLVLAAMGAYSRVYLSQHFLSDVCVGSIIGFTTPFLMFWLCRNKVLKLKKEETK